MSMPNGGSREELEQNVVMLEQILEVMPDDLFTMRSLFEASLTLEQPEKAFGTLQRLDELSCSSGNLEMIDYVLAQYRSIAEDDADIQAKMARLQTVKNGMMPSGEEPPSEPAAEGGGRIEAEMALAWDLYQDEVVSQEEYSSILHDLTELSGNKMGVPVTVLHILHDRQFSRFERLMTHLCQKYSMPVMVLSQFDENEEISRLLPLEFMSANGAIPFARVGGDLLLGVLNPLDQELLREAETLSGSTCHPYLVQPDEYDRQLKKAGNPAEY